MIFMPISIVDKAAIEGLDRDALKALCNRLNSEISAVDEQLKELKKARKLVEAELKKRKKK